MQFRFVVSLLALERNKWFGIKALFKKKLIDLT